MLAPRAMRSRLVRRGKCNGGAIDPSIGERIRSVSSTFLDLKPRGGASFRIYARSSARIDSAACPPDLTPIPLAAPLHYIVEGGHTLAGSIRPSGNKNAALPIVAAALLTEQAGHLDERPAHPRHRNARRAAPSRSASRPSGPSATRSSSTRRRCSRASSTRCSARRFARRFCSPDRCSRAAARSRSRRRAATSSAAVASTRTFSRSSSSARRSRSARSTCSRTTGLRGADVFLDEPSVTATENALDGGESPPRARRCCATPPASRTCRTSRTSSSRWARRSRGSARTRSRSTARRRSHGATHRDRPRSHRGRLVHRARRGHALRDAHRRTPASSTCARRCMGFERLGIVCTVDGDDLIVAAEAELRDSRAISAATCPSSRISRGPRSRRTPCRSRSSRRRSATG